MTKDFKIAIIIITYNRPGDMLELARNISSLDYQDFLQDVVVINNRSTEDYSTVATYFEKHPETPFRYFISDENLGVARGRNFALQKTSAPILVFIDDDALFRDKDALRLVHEIFSEDKDEIPGISAFRIFYKSTMDFQVNAFPHKQFLARKDWHQFDTYFFSGCAHAVQKSVFETAGHYPENFFYGMEEYDLSYRVVNTGFKIIYDDRVTILHKESPSGRLTNKEKLRGMWVNKSKVAWKYLPKRYFYSTALLWSGKYLATTRFHFNGWLKGWSEISKIPAGEKRSPLSKETMNYLKKVQARLWY